ncbi:hypothetical protein [Amycolatopsis sp. cmx-4-83]|uniref:hypothetical protein n=1 Tax=Amycolatopsis sp. cmx-4-83 TaxID=2790940 RepID=UPI00397C82C7
MFSWSLQNMHVESTVTAVKPARCTAWGAPVNGITGVHLWTFRQTRGGVLATTEEPWAGPHRLRYTAEKRGARTR